MFFTPKTFWTTLCTLGSTKYQKTLYRLRDCLQAKIVMKQWAKLKHRPTVYSYICKVTTTLLCPSTSLSPHSRTLAQNLSSRTFSRRLGLQSSYSSLLEYYWCKYSTDKENQRLRQRRPSLRWDLLKEVFKGRVQMERSFLKSKCRKLGILMVC